MKTSLPAGLEERLHELAEKLTKAYGEAEVYLYGSFAKGTWLEDSDVDIIVVSPFLARIPFTERINEIRKMAPPEIPIQILAYTPEELENAKRRSVVLQDAAEYWKKIEEV